jgi:hypothetical protein
MSDRRHPRFVICIRNGGYVASLELRKLDEVVDDAEAAQHAMIRVMHRNRAPIPPVHHGKPAVGHFFGDR